MKKRKAKTNYHTYSNGETFTTVISTTKGKRGRARLKRKSRARGK